VKSRLLVTIVLAVVVVPLLVAGLGYYYLFATLAGTFSVPALYSARLTAPDGGRILVEGVGVTGWRARGSRWRARYAPPGSERSEDVGSWIGGHDEFAIVRAAGHLVLIAGPDQVFVRTEKGPWKSFPVPFVDEWERLASGRAVRTGCGRNWLGAGCAPAERRRLLLLGPARGVGGESDAPGRGRGAPLLPAFSRRRGLRPDPGADAVDGAAGYIRRLTSVSVGATSSANMRIERRARRVSSPGRAISRRTRR
jgi:hypothetical protein